MPVGYVCMFIAHGCFKALYLIDLAALWQCDIVSDL